MTRSIWRLSHLSLALVASLFLILASVSGIFLAYEPIQNKTKAVFFSEWNTTPLSVSIDSLQSKYLEVTTVEKDVNGFFVAAVLTEEGDFETFQINPKTGEKSGEINKQSKFYEWMTSFHRSLFLDTLGRFFVGLTAVILFFIAVSGIILVIQRTRSIRGLFDKVEKTLNVRFYHIVFGRLAFIPIIIISLTGGYLFLQRFEVIKVQEIPPLIVDDEHPSQHPEKLDFSTLTLGEIKKIEFPFSPDEEDYFIIQTAESEIAVHQYDHTILARVDYPTTTILSDLSLNLHTGRTNPIWSVILGVSCLSILYFIYSGFKMTLLSRKGKTRNKYTLEESELLILTGSETGNTLTCAKLVYQHLIRQGYKVFLTELNKYKPSDTVRQLIIFTSTYGTGDAPVNASKFIQKWKANPLKQEFQYSIVGFGSLAYPDFCQFATDLEKELSGCPNAKALIPLVKIHNQSYHSLKTWATDWKNASGFSLELPASIQAKKLPLKSFLLVSKKVVTDHDNETFTMQLKSIRNGSFQSGDLLAVYPPGDPYERFYSIGKTDKNELVISVKKHEFGICSAYLSGVELNTIVEAGIKPNKDFHYNPGKAAVFIGNGTGMGPFLGMVAENRKKKPIHLYWGGRNRRSYSLYEHHLEHFSGNGMLASVNLAFSRETEQKTYVGDLIHRDAEIIAVLLKKGAVIYICGSLAMQQDVLDELEKACKKFAGKPLNHFQKRGQVKMDCY